TCWGGRDAGVARVLSPTEAGVGPGRLCGGANARSPRDRAFSRRALGRREVATYRANGSADLLRPLHLFRKSAEPGREQEQLVDLVSRHLRRRWLMLREDVLDQLLHRASILRGSGLRHFRAHDAAANEIDLVLALVPWHRVHEGQILHRKPQPAKLAAQRLETF